MVKFKRQYYDDFPSVGEKGGGELIVDASGYVTAEQQIFAMIDAGIRLDQARREMYDYDGDSDDPDMDDIPYDKLRVPGIDMAEVSQMQLAVKRRLERQRAKALELQKSEAAEPEIKAE